MKRKISEACDVTIGVKMYDHERGAPQPGWLEGTIGGLTMLVALDGDDEQILWGGMNVRRIAPLVGSYAQVSCVTLEHYFGRRYVGDVSWNNVDLTQIANDVVDSISTAGIGLVVAATNTGVKLSGEYANSEDIRVAAVLETLSTLYGGIEYAVELGWANADHTVLTKTLRIAPRIGLAPVTPTTWSFPGCITGGNFTEDFTTEFGANDVTAVSSGEVDRPSARASDEALIGGGWPRYERRWTPGTSITRESTLESHAAAELVNTRLGLTQFDFTADSRTAPRFGVDWFLGDDLMAEVSCDRFPEVATITGGTADAVNLTTTPKNQTPYPNDSFWPVTANVAITGHPLGFTVGARVNPTSGAGNALASVYNLDGLGDTAISRWLGVWVKANRAANAHTYSTASGDGPEVSLLANVWTWVRTGTASVGHISLIVFTAAGNVVAGTDKVEIAGVVSAVAGAGSYFDGDTPDNNLHTYDWTGTPNASTSTRTPNNYMRSPGFTERLRATGVELDFDNHTVKPITQEADS
ncbi:hypothetical protein [Nocardioides sp. InS609-2]|uniref:hypothetical protein n=1 Tax=Nocardioides sp. InS609-2 TaxID=2760705 RepID=UPI0020BDE7D3|nr:hypothetical protein [Nocardioides sp. InS609-2]